MNFDEIRAKDFQDGKWLQEIDADYKKYVEHSKTPSQYWEETFHALNNLWDPQFRAAFLVQVSQQWRAGKIDDYAFIPISGSYSYPEGVMLHVQYNCPASQYFMPESKEQRLKFANKVIAFTVPNQEYLQPLLACIKSMHLDLYNTYRSACNLGDSAKINRIFNAPRYGCLNEKIRAIQTVHLSLTLDLPWDQAVQMILADYTKFVCTANNWDLISYNELAQKDHGVHFYLEDIIAFAVKYYATIKGRQGNDSKNIEDLEETLEAWSLCDRRPLTAEQQEHLTKARLEREDAYQCAISLEIMQNPVDAACGHTFEKEKIEAWFTQQHKTANAASAAAAAWSEQTNVEIDTCPLCKQKAVPLTANNNLRREIAAFIVGGHLAAEAERAKIDRELKQLKKSPGIFFSSAVRVAKPVPLSWPHVNMPATFTINNNVTTFGTFTMNSGNMITNSGTITVNGGALTINNGTINIIGNQGFNNANKPVL